jgi:hypothetical protein
MFEEDGQTRTHPSCGRGKLGREEYKKRKRSSLSQRLLPTEEYSSSRLKK